MRILFIGGTGNISTAVSRLAVESGMELYLLNRGKRKDHFPGAKILLGDINQPDQVQHAIEGMQFDVVVNWIAFNPDDIERDLALFQGKVGQYVFISSASAYRKPPTHPIITESTPLYNPYWDYSQNKIRCEARLMRAYQNENFPVTIVRPSLTYDTVFPIAIGGWQCYTLADRMLKGQKIIIHGDGSSLWTVTHAEDFAKGFIGLLGHPQAIGHAFHITSDELLTWNQIYTTIAETLGVQPDVVHIPSNFIARVSPGVSAGLLGDKTWSVIFDNTKIKSFVPSFTAAIPFHKGIQRTIAWFAEDERRRWVNPEVNKEIDKIIFAYKNVM